VTDGGREILVEDFGRTVSGQGHLFARKISYSISLSYVTGRVGKDGKQPLARTQKGKKEPGGLPPRLSFLSWQV